jgi:hypothetical protein
MRYSLNVRREKKERRNSMNEKARKRGSMNERREVCLRREISDK